MYKHPNIHAKDQKLFANKSEALNEASSFRKDDELGVSETLRLDLQEGEGQ